MFYLKDGWGRVVPCTRAVVGWSFFSPPRLGILAFWDLCVMSWRDVREIFCSEDTEIRDGRIEYVIIRFVKFNHTQEDYFVAVGHWLDFLAFRRLRIKQNPSVKVAWKIEGF